MLLPEPFVLYFLVPEKRVQCLSDMIEAYNSILHIAPLQSSASGQYGECMDTIVLVEPKE